MKLILLVLSLSSFAFADAKFDCRTGVDPHGGKYCYYTMPMLCENESCEAAAKCAVEKYEAGIARNIVSAGVMSSTEFTEEGRTYVSHEIRTMESCNGNRCQKTGMVVTQPLANRNVCIPIAYYKD